MFKKPSLLIATRLLAVFNFVAIYSSNDDLKSTLIPRSFPQSTPVRGYYNLLWNFSLDVSIFLLTLARDTLTTLRPFPKRNVVNHKLSCIFVKYYGTVKIGIISIEVNCRGHSVEHWFWEDNEEHRSYHWTLRRSTSKTCPLRVTVAFYITLFPAEHEVSNPIESNSLIPCLATVPSNLWNGTQSKAFWKPIFTLSTSIALSCSSVQSSSVCSNCKVLESPGVKTNYLTEMMLFDDKIGVYVSGWFSPWFDYISTSS